MNFFRFHFYFLGRFFLHIIYRLELRRQLKLFCFIPDSLELLSM